MLQLDDLVAGVLPVLKGFCVSIVSDRPVTGDYVVARLNERAFGLLVVVDAANYRFHSPHNSELEALERARQVAAPPMVDIWRRTSDTTFERVVSNRGQISGC
jgi:hypothetical protein